MLRSSATSCSDVERLWSVVSDLTAWPRHLPTFTSLVPADDAVPTEVGSRFDVRQPGLPAATYEVTEWIPGSSFTWMARSPGIRTTATHSVRAVEEGSRLDLSIDWSGALAAPVRLLLGRRTLRMIELEATTLAREAESRD